MKERKIKMKYVRQFLIIIFISFVGELIHYYIDLPIPGSIYGMLILFVLLQFKVIKVEHVKDIADFLIEVMPLMFIPAGVGLLEKWGLIKGVWLPLTITIIGSTLIVMVVSGRVSQLVIRKKERLNQES